jgi:hypothetical protein
MKQSQAIKLLSIFAFVAIIGLVFHTDESGVFRRMLVDDEEELDNFESFQNFKEGYEKNYGHDQEFKKFKTFKNNLEFIEKFESDYDEGLHHS